LVTFSPNTNLQAFTGPAFFTVTPSPGQVNFNEGPSAGKGWGEVLCSMEFPGSP